jgi:hypothetical protein
MENNKSPWYETNLIWGPVSLGVGILLAVVAMKHDLRWLLWLAAPCFIFAAIVIVHNWVRGKMLVLCSVVLAAVIVIATLGLHKWLGIPEKLGSVGSADSNSLAKTPPADKNVGAQDATTSPSPTVVKTRKTVKHAGNPTGSISQKVVGNGNTTNAVTGNENVVGNTINEGPSNATGVDVHSLAHDNHLENIYAGPSVAGGPAVSIGVGAYNNTVKNLHVETDWWTSELDSLERYYEDGPPGVMDIFITETQAVLERLPVGEKQSAYLAEWKTIVSRLRASHASKTGFFATVEDLKLHRPSFITDGIDMSGSPFAPPPKEAPTSKPN